jgi:hypothetical protein
MLFPYRFSGSSMAPALYKGQELIWRLRILFKFEKVVEMTLHLHIGAHKTATTHLQAILHKNRAALADHDVDYLPPENIREAIKYWRIAAETMAPFPTVSGALAKRKLAKMDTGASRIIASDENSLGHCRTMIRRGELYGRALPRLRLWRLLAAKRQTTVYLAIRNYAPFFTSAYAQSIRSARYYGLTALTLEELSRLPRRWPDVVKDIRRALPGARVIVWDFKDYKALRLRILEQMCGFEPPKHVKRRPMATPSTAGMAAFANKAYASASGVVERKDRLAILSAHPVCPEDPRFDPWPPHISQLLADKFAEDKAQLMSQLGADFLVPDKT